MTPVERLITVQQTLNKSDPEVLVDLLGVCAALATSSRHIPHCSEMVRLCGQNML